MIAIDTTPRMVPIGVGLACSRSVSGVPLLLLAFDPSGNLYQLLDLAAPGGEQTVSTRGVSLVDG